jgi:HSP20 family molecular chaperone IbpA
MTETNINIPLDVYESPEEIVIIIPLGWVKKESLQIRLEKTNLFIKWDRIQPKLKETLKPIIQKCYWGQFSKKIELPQNIYFDKIHSILTPENILIISVPKIIIPEKIEIKIN